MAGDFCWTAGDSELGFNMALAQQHCRMKCWPLQLLCTQHVGCFCVRFKAAVVHFVHQNMMVVCYRLPGNVMAMLAHIVRIRQLQLLRLPISAAVSCCFLFRLIAHSPLVSAAWCINLFHYVCRPGDKHVVLLV